MSNHSKIKEKILSEVIETQIHYKETQRQSWNSVALGWQEWWQATTYYINHCKQLLYNYISCTN
jgi:hypothetical protein